MLAAIRILSIVGLVIFGPVLLAAAFAPQQVEQAAKTYVKAQAKQEVDRYFDSFAGKAVKKTYEALQEKYAEQLAGSQAALKAGLPGLVAEWLAALCHYDCATKEEVKKALTEGLEKQIATLQRALDKVKALAQDKYAEVTAKIRRDLMIFSGSNTAVFAMLLALTILRRDYARPLALPAVLMLIATAASTGIYVFGQDWFWIILTDSYMGFGYLVYLGIIFFFLMDIVYNKARVTQAFLEALGQALAACVPG
jgi:multidrug efflux pump subunit AcrA (membrane-fusion protein)